MMTLKVKDKEYKVKFGYNSFCDTDLLDRTTEIMGILKGSKETTKDNEFTRRLFNVVRELLFEGFKRYNPAENLEEIGYILDDYFEEGTEEDSHGLVSIFGLIAQELLTEGFFGDLLTQSEKAIKTLTEKAQNKKKS